jgi:hypothetical protein
MSLKRATIAFATFFGLALIASFAPESAAAFTAAQKAACGGDAQRLCSSSMSDPQQLTRLYAEQPKQGQLALPCGNGWWQEKESWLTTEESPRRLDRPAGRFGYRCEG